MNESKLNIAYEQLKEYMLLCAGKAKLKLSNGFTTLNPSDGLYYGLWPDDFLFPIIVCPELLNKEELVSVMDFLTASTVGLEVVPDRIESDGMPMMSPGWYDSPLSYKMPAHMPAPWVRLLDYFEGWGVEIPQKSAWAKLIKRSFDNISFACGLVYMDPQKPYVGFAYHDNIAITGFDLMSSIVLHKAFERAAKLFNGYIEEEVINEWKAKSVAIQDNLWRLYDKDKGGFVAGSKDCRQINVWANGLIYGLLDDEEKKSSIFEFYKKNSDKIFKSGFTRQIAEDTGWERLLTDLEVGQYMNGVFGQLEQAMYYLLFIKTMRSLR